MPTLIVMFYLVLGKLLKGEYEAKLPDDNMWVCCSVMNKISKFKMLKKQLWFILRK